jgi:2-amino-4-hydroxy-6-hydroxymethyldihydropteridine diphosphokinase
VVAALSLGGNMGDVTRTFRHALDRLAAAPGVRVTARSRVYCTPAWGRTDQPDFLNLAALVETRLAPRDLLALCLAIEKECGRVRLERWGPRTLDIDILTYGDRHIEEPGLTIPHPRMTERAFVLVPLAEIAPDMIVAGARVGDLAAGIDRTGIVPDGEAAAGPA